MNTKQTALDAYLGTGHRRGHRPWSPAGRSLLVFVENPLPDDWKEQRDVIGALAK